MDNNGTPLYQLWRKRRRLKIRLFFLLLALIALFIWLRPHLFPSRAPSAQSQQPANATGSGVLTKGTPSYPTVTPSKKPVEWTRISPPGSDEVYTFVDEIAGVSITVSEQPLPEQLEEDTYTKLEELAKNYNANRYITVDGARVFIGTSTKGPQSLILSKRSLLILIKSSAALNDEQWTSYIQSLN